MLLGIYSCPIVIILDYPDSMIKSLRDLISRPFPADLQK